MNRDLRFVLAGGVSALLLSSSLVVAQEWKPDRPINLVVPWGAGGSTDQVIRVTAPIIGEALGVDVVVMWCNSSNRLRSAARVRGNWSSCANPASPAPTSSKE